jgi:carboxyl-terminal processing protease
MATLKQLLKQRRLLIWLAALALLFACSDESEVEPMDKDLDDEPEIIEDSYAETNQWIHENMNLYYLWNNEIPYNIDYTQEPTYFFESLLNKYDEVSNPEGDRFSFISEDADELLAEFSGESKSYGMEYRLLYQSSGGNEILAQVIYVVDDSPARFAGIERGYMFTKINGTVLTDDNYFDLLFSGDDMTINRVSFVNGKFVEQGNNINLVKTVTQEDPILLDTTYTFDNLKIGYLVYNQFIPGPYGSNIDEYDLQLEEIFGQFKTDGIDELIVDLRYNPGGYVSSSITLASLIGKGADSNTLFYREEYNEEFQNYLLQVFGEDYLYINFEDKPSNIGNQINSVYFLVSNYTASSSELVMNGLLPYMNVYLIGEQTYGKNVGSFTISSDNQFDTNWALQPIVVKSYNSLGQSDYTSGFYPDAEAYESLDLVPFGDISDPLLNNALQLILGTDKISRKAADIRPKILASSVSQKRVTLKQISLIH